MSRQIQIRRGTTVENDNFTGAEGEITVDTTTKQLRIHDGTTMGGFIVGRESYTKTETDALLSGKSSTDLSNITADGKETIAHNAMPSDRYIDLTLGASGTQYTAPADGWFFISKVATGANQFVILEKPNKNSIRETCFVPNSGYWASVTLPVRKGDTVVCEYDAGGAVQGFGFIYANGVQ